MGEQLRTEAEALRLRPTAINFLMRVEALLPPGEFDVDYATTFVGVSVPEEVACAMVSVRGFPLSLTALEFALHGDPEDYADALVRYRDRLIQEGRDAEGSSE